MYVQKKRGIVLILVVTLAILSSVWYVNAAEEYVTSCAWALNTPGNYYSLINSVTSGTTAETCFEISSSHITLDCKGFQITYAPTGVGVGISNVGGYKNVTIQNCVIIDGSSETVKHHHGIVFLNAVNGTIMNNIINTSHGISHGIVLEDSNYNHLSNNNISLRYSSYYNPVGGIWSDSCGIVINGSSEYNRLINTNFSVNTSSFAIFHDSLKPNILKYNNSQASITWNRTNLTTSINLSIGLNVFLDNGLAGLISPRLPTILFTQNLNSTAKIQFRNLSYQNMPRIFKDGRRCDNVFDTDPVFACSNITTYGSGVLDFNVTSFSNYTLQDNDPPNVTILFPANGAIFGFGFMIGFNATILDFHTFVSNINITFQFTNKTSPFNRTAEYGGATNRWNVTLNSSLFAEGTHGFRVWANDSLNNINNTEFVNFTLDFTAPNVTFTGLTPYNGTNLSFGMRGFNVTVFDNITNVTAVLFQFENGTSRFNKTASNLTHAGNSALWNVTVNVSNLTEGRIAVVIYANDSANNLNNTVSITINVDRTAPLVNIFSTPALTSDVTPSFQFNFSDFSSSANCSLYFNASLNSTNSAVANGTDTNLTAATELLSGNYVASINCTDAFGNIGGNSFAIAVNSTNVTDCRALRERGETYVLSNYVVADGTCFTILANDVNLQCRGYNITYGGATNSAAVDDNGYSNITIKNCPMLLKDCTLCDIQSMSAIVLQNVDDSLVFNNSIRTKIFPSSHGIVLSESNNNTLSFNNLSTIGVGILINGTSRGNTLYNNTIGASTHDTGLYSIRTLSSAPNYLYYNNSFGSILWNSSNLTTSVAIAQGINIFLENNLVGLLDASGFGLENLNKTAQIEIKNLDYFNTPRLMKAGQRCDNVFATDPGFACNVSYDPSTDILTANVTSFSNFSSGENDPPNVTITNPGNGTNFSLRSPLQSFNLTAFDSTNISAALFRFNSNTTPFNVSATNRSGNWGALVNLSALPEGTHTVRAFVNDTNNAINDTETVTIIVDLTAPNVSVYWWNVTNSSNYTNSGVIHINATLNDTLTTVTDVKFGIFNYRNNTEFNVTATKLASSWYYNLVLSTLSESLYNVRVYGNDTVGNLNNSVNNLSFTVDTTPPNVSIYWWNVTNSSSYTNSGVIHINATLNDTLTTVTDVKFGIFNYRNNTEFNVTATKLASSWYYNLVLSTLSESLYNVRVYGNDTVGNLNNSVNNLSFTVDRTAPNVSITSPLEGTNFSYNMALQNFNAMVLDNTTLIDTVIFYFSNLTNGFNRTATNISGTWQINFNVSSLEVGTHTVKVFANDTVGNMNDSQTTTINVNLLDTTAPNVNIISPLNNSNFSHRSALQTFEASVSDSTTAVSQVIFYFSNNSNPFNQTATYSYTIGIGQIEFNMSRLAEGHHIVKVFANDTAANMNSSEFINITVDKTAPLVNITTPLSGLVNGVVQFNATIREELLQVNTVFFQFENGAQNFTATNYSGVWSITLDIGLLSDGVQTMTVYANDSVNNVNNTISLSITVDNFPDTIIGGTSPATPPPSEPAEEPPAAETPAEAPAEPASSEVATAGEVSRGIRSSSFDISVTSKLDVEPAVSAAEKIAAGAWGEVEVKNVIITNRLDKTVVLSAMLREPDISLENEDSIKKRIGEVSTSIGDAEFELAAIKLLERVEVLQVYKTKMSTMFPRTLTGAAVAPLLTPTHDQISARLLRDSLVNANDFQNLQVAPGETIAKEVKLRRGLTLDNKQAAELVFSAGGEEVFAKDLGGREKLTAGTVVDLDAVRNTLDFYVLVPPKNGGGKEVFTVELEINAKKPVIKSSPLPLKVMLPALFAERSKTVYSELYGPYTVNLERGALLAVQYDASALAGKYDAIGRIYLGGSQLIAENRYQIES